MHRYNPLITGLFRMGYKRLAGLFFSWVLLASLNGCSVYPLATATATTHGTDSVNSLACLPALIRLDQWAEKNAGTLQGERIAHMPWLRSNRLLHSYFTDVVKVAEAAAIPKTSKADGLISSPSKTYPSEQLTILLNHMSELAYQGLLSEWLTVPLAQKSRWKNRYHIQQATPRFIRHCLQQAVQKQLQHPKSTQTELLRIPVDQDYARWARILGVYPLSALAFRQGVLHEQKQLRQQWGKPQSINARWSHYPPAETRPVKPITQWPAWAVDALGLPIIDAAARQSLLQQYAPHWYVASDTAANRPGQPYWRDQVLQVDTRRPVSFSTVSVARWQDKAVLQLNYVLWFSERPPLRALDWVAGQHDAVVFRVFLQRGGEVLAYDSIHLCGCWYRLFLPEKRRFLASKARGLWQEPVLMERVTSSKRMAVYLSADTHQIIWVAPVTQAREQAEKHPYLLKSFDTLNQLSIPKTTPSNPLGPSRLLIGEHPVQSIFDTAGYVPGSERPERWLFWPMGVKNPGALRRFGDHAISFIGQRHFDDPFLLEKLGVR